VRASIVSYFCYGRMKRNTENNVKLQSEIMIVHSDLLSLSKGKIEDNRRAEGKGTEHVFSFLKKTGYLKNRR